MKAQNLATVMIILWGFIMKVLIVLSSCTRAIEKFLFNSMLKKNLSLILADFNAKKYCPGCKRKKVISIFVKETTNLSLHLMKVT